MHIVPPRPSRSEIYKHMEEGRVRQLEREVYRREFYCSKHSSSSMRSFPPRPSRVSPTDSSSDSASHTHSARRSSAAALLTRSRGGGLTTPLAHSRTQTHTISYGIAIGVYSLYLPLSLTRCWGAGSSSLADVEKRKGEVKRPSREALGSKEGRAMNEV